MEIAAEDNTRKYIRSRTELAYPNNNWENTWHLSRVKGMGADVTSFLWKLLHKLLPTQDRVSRILKNKSSSPLCQHCQEQVVEDLQHAFFKCSFNRDAGTLLLNCLDSYMPGLSTTQILHLNFELEPSKEFPVVWLTGSFLQNIWSARVEKKQARLYSIRADLEARASLLRETRFKNEAILITEMLELCFNAL